MLFVCFCFLIRWRFYKINGQDTCSYTSKVWRWSKQDIGAHRRGQKKSVNTALPSCNWWSRIWLVVMGFGVHRSIRSEECIWKNLSFSIYRKSHIQNCAKFNSPTHPWGMVVMIVYIANIVSFWIVCFPLLLFLTPTSINLFPLQYNIIVILTLYTDTNFVILLIAQASQPPFPRLRSPDPK